MGKEKYRQERYVIKIRRSFVTKKYPFAMLPDWKLLDLEKWMIWDFYGQKHGKTFLFTMCTILLVFDK